MARGPGTPPVSTGAARTVAGGSWRKGPAPDFEILLGTATTLTECKQGEMEPEPHPPLPYPRLPFDQDWKVMGMMTRARTLEPFFRPGRNRIRGATVSAASASPG